MEKKIAMITIGVLILVAAYFVVPKFFNQLAEDQGLNSTHESNYEKRIKNNGSNSNKSYSNSTNSKKGFSESDISKVKIDIINLDRTYGTNYVNINYKITNNLSTEIKNMHIQFTLLDENHNPITSKDWGTADNIPSGQIQQGTAYVEYSGSISDVTYKIKYLSDINGNEYGNYYN